MKLKKFLENSDNLVILGIGNELRGDDFIGSLLARRFSKLFKESNNIMVFDGGTVPENYTGAIKKENPTEIILIDAADMGKEAGYIKIIELNRNCQLSFINTCNASFIFSEVS